MFAFGAHVDIAPLGLGSPLYSRHVLEQELHTPLELYVGILPEGIPCISSCNFISYILLALLRFMPTPCFIFISHVAWACLNPSQADPFTYPLQLDHPLPGGDPLPSVLILRILPCIEHRYVPLLGTSFISPDTCLLLVVHYKALLFFFKLFNIWKSPKKFKKPKNPDGKWYYLW